MRCLASCPYKCGPCIYLSVTQSETYCVPWQNPRATALLLQCESINTHPHMYSPPTSFYPQGCLRKSTRVQWPSMCSVYEPYVGSCNWSGDAHVWWWGTQRWENVNQVDRLVSARIKMRTEEAFCAGKEVLHTAYPYPGWHHCTWYCRRVSN